MILNRRKQWQQQITVYVIGAVVKFSTTRTLTISLKKTIGPASTKLTRSADTDWIILAIGSAFVKIAQSATSLSQWTGRNNGTQ